MKSRRQRFASWKLPVIALVAIVLSGPVIILSSRPEAFRFGFNLTNWRFGVSETETGSGRRFSGTTTKYLFGPIALTAHRPQARRVPLRTNQVKVGMTLFDPHSGEPRGLVVDVVSAYLFDDERIRPAVLLQTQHGIDVWVPREKLNKALISQ